MNNNFFKKTIYKSVHRGCKETDILIGDFAVNQLQYLSKLDLENYINLIEEDDFKIYQWILSKEKIPSQYQEIIFKIQKFHNL